ncbi:HLH domain containing protein [Trichuris trichiura]|uniref:HLH domain containing protein n=1 Tax=Trichuris trichiura TaxID=36087 RepID=A0A077ZDY9_TRITR|nr:HLH domain containing protein [Trichuris trichiura]
MMYWSATACNNGQYDANILCPSAGSFNNQADDSFWSSATTVQCPLGSISSAHTYDLAFSDYLNSYQNEIHEATMPDRMHSIMLDNHVDAVQEQCIPSILLAKSKNRHKEPACIMERNNRARMRNLLKERRRSEAIRKAFRALKYRIPYVPTDKSVTQIKTLRLAIQYIRYLEAQLVSSQSNILGNSNFADVVVAEISRKNSYVKASRKL